MKIQERKLKTQMKLSKKKNELKVILVEIEEKKAKDIAIYGKPLSNKQLRDKAESKKRAIKNLVATLNGLEGKLEQKFKLSKRDSRVLDAIRGKTNIANTTTNDKGSKYDNRFNGSANSRKIARQFHRRNTQ